MCRCERTLQACECEQRPTISQQLPIRQDAHREKTPSFELEWSRGGRVDVDRARVEWRLKGCRWAGTEAVATKQSAHVHQLAVKASSRLAHCCERSAVAARERRSCSTSAALPAITTSAAYGAAPVEWLPPELLCHMHHSLRRQAME